MENFILNLCSINLRTFLRRLLLIIVAASFSLIAVAGTKTWSGSVSSDWNTAANWTTNVVPSSGETVLIPGGLTNYPIISSSITIGTVNLNSTGSGATLTITAGATFSVGNLVTVYAGGSFIQNGGTSVLSGINNSGVVIVSGGTLLSSVNITVKSGGIFNQSGGMIHLANSLSTSPSDYLILLAGGVYNQTGGTIYVRDLGAGAGTFNQNGSTALFKIIRNWKPGAGSVFNSTSGTVQFTGGSSSSDFSVGSIQYNHVLIDAGIDPKFSATNGAKIYVSGNYTNNNTTLDCNSGSTFIFNGLVDQTITSASSSTKCTFGNLTVDKDAGVLKLLSNITIAANSTVDNGIFNLGTYTANRKSSGGSFNISADGILLAGGSTGGLTGSNFPLNFSTINLEPSSKVEFNGANQTVPNLLFGNLILSSSSGAATKTMPATALTIAGDLTSYVGAGTSVSFTAASAITVKGSVNIGTGTTFTGGAFTHNVAGNWTCSGTYTATGNTIIFNGTTNQVVSSLSPFNNVNINKASDNVSLSSNFTVTGLTFTRGQIVTGTYNVIIPSGGTVTGAGASTGWVFGNLQKYFSATAGGNFEIGGAIFYSPLSISFASITTAGSLIAKATANSHPQVGTSTMSTKNVGRYFTLTKPATGALAYTTATIVFNWNTADNYTGLVASAVKVANYSNAAWTYPVVSGTPTSSQVQATGIANTGDFAIGEITACTISSGFSYASTNLCSNAGTANVTLNTGATAGTFTSTPAGLSFNSASGAVNPTASTIGNYTVTNTVTNGGCVSTSSVTIGIVAAPYATIAYSSPSICQTAAAATVTRTGTAGGVFSATPLGLNINSSTGTVTLSNSKAGTYTVKYTLTSAYGCATYVATTTLTVLAAPTAAISYDGTPYCLNGGSANVTFSGTSGGTFSSTAGLVINATTGAINLTSSTVGSYTVTYTLPAANGCAAISSSTIVDINNTASPTISYTGSPYCTSAGTANVTLSGTAGGTYSSTAGLLLDGTTGAIDLSQSTPGTYTVTYFVAPDGGCSASTTATVTITAAPSATISYSGSPYCISGTTANVTRTSTSGGTYSAGSGLSINSSTGSINLAASTPGTYTVTYTVAAANGCSAFTTTAPVTVTAAPSATISYASATFCNTGSATVTRSGSAGGTYSGTTGLAIDATTGTINLASSTPGTHTITYTIAASGGCSSFSTTATLIIAAAPSATISYSGSPYCTSGTTANVTRTGTSGGTYSAGSGISINATTGSINLAASTPGTYTVTYTVAAANGCSVYTTTAPVTVTAAPSATISYASATFCNTGSATVTRSGSAGGTYSGTTGLVIDATTGTINLASSAAGLHTVTYTIAAGGGCSSFSTTATLTIAAAPSASISYSGSPYCTSGTTANVTLTGTSGGTYSAGSGLSINITTGSINLAASTPGTYTVTYTVAAASGCSLFTTTAPVTITAAPSATISYSSTIFCNTGSVSVNRSGSSGGTFSGTTGLAIDASTGTINLASSTLGNHTVTYTIAAANGCSSYSTTTPVTIAVLGTWTGSTDNDWNKGTNWSCNNVPSANDNVIIPAGLSRYPVITSSAAVKNLNLAAGATITVSTATLKIGGTVTGTGTINATSSYGVEFNGTAAQTIPANLFTGNTVNYLIINNTVSVTLGGPLDITDLLSVKNGVLNTSNMLTLKSTVTATARIGTVSSSATTPINGKVTVERYVPGRRKYRLITSSVTTSTSSTLSAGQEAQSIWGNWQNSGNNTAGNNGTIITGGTVADGFDPQTSNPSLFSYDAVNRKFVAFTSANGKNTKYTPLKAGVAYYMFVFGDRINSIGTTSPNSTVLKQTGTVLTGDQLYTTTSAIPLSNEVGKFTLIGNPFACTIDWKSVQKSKVSNTIWGWDANLSSTGGYVTVTATTTGSLISPLSTLTRVNRYVQPGQGFFIQTTALNPSIIISESSKVEDKTSIENLVFRENQEDLQPLMAINLLYDKGEDKVLADGAVAAFDDTFNNGVSEEDGIKMFNSTETVAIKADTSFLSISARKMPSSADTIALNLQKLSKSKYTLQVFANNMANSPVVPYLQDNYLHTEQLLSLTDTNHIDFYVVTSEAASYDASRFRIVFKTSGTLPVSFVSLNATKADKNARVDWSVGVQTNVKKYEVEKSIDGVFFTKQYEVVAGSALKYSWLDANMGAGTTYYRIRAVENDGKYLLSHIVSVKFDKSNSSIRVFPNPVKGQSIHIYLKEIEKGDYTYSIVNAAGVEVFNKKAANNGGSSSEILNLYKKLPQGIYFLKITGKNSDYSEKIVVD